MSWVRIPPNPLRYQSFLVGPVKQKVKERKVLENKEIGEPSLSTVVTIERRGLDPWTLYLYAMKSPATKEKYLMRLGKFLDFLNLQK